MRKLITLIIGCFLAFTLALQAKQPEEAKADAKKAKNAQKQQVAPRPQHQFKPHKQAQTFTTPNAHASVNGQTHANAKVHTRYSGPKVSRKHVQEKPVVSDTPVPMRTDKFQKRSEKFQAKQQQQLEQHQPVVQSDNPRKQFKRAKLNQQAIAKIKAQHKSFHAKPNTSVASVRFNQNYQIQKAQTWDGAKYQVFRSYRPQWHDRSWWSTHHHRLSLIGGGWYYWDAGYWYPAWGYDEAAAYYPYDGPIYSGPGARPFDQVVADVQAALQEQGYYQGEVDGLLGPLTRQALAEYQSANGLYATETIDEPTLDSLGMT